MGRRDEKWVNSNCDSDAQWSVFGPEGKQSLRF